MQGSQNPPEVRRTSGYAATTKEKGNAADGRFSTACCYETGIVKSQIITVSFKSKQMGQRVASTMNQTVIRGLGTNSIQ